MVPNLTHFDFFVSKCVELVPNLTHFEIFFQSALSWSQIQRTLKKFSKSVIFSKRVATMDDTCFLCIFRRVLYECPFWCKSSLKNKISYFLTGQYNLSSQLRTMSGNLIGWPFSVYEKMYRCWQTAMDMEQEATKRRRQTLVMIKEPVLIDASVILVAKPKF